MDTGARVGYGYGLHVVSRDNIYTVSTHYLPCIYPVSTEYLPSIYTGEQGTRHRGPGGRGEAGGRGPGGGLGVLRPVQHGLVGN